MRELSNFFKILKKHKYTIIVIPVISAIITFFIVRRQPSLYTSQAKLATGFVDQTQRILPEGIEPAESKISQDFSNVVEMLKSKKNLDQISYTLMIHDLTSEHPYRSASSLLKQLNASARDHAIKTFTQLYNTRQSLSLFNSDQNGLYRLLRSMQYDDQSILKTLLVYRIQNSDYIQVQFDSESSILSAVVVNGICSEFISYYSILINDSHQKALDFWKAMMLAKQDTMNKRMAELKAYKIKNHVLNLNEKARALYGQISDFETKKEETQKNIQSTQAAIDHIDNQFNPNDRQYLESTKVALSQQILASKAQLQELNDLYVKSNFNPQYKAKIDSINNVITGQIQLLSDRYILNPMATKQSLAEQKQTLKIQNELAKHSAAPINNEINRLNSEFNSLVPHEGSVQAYENAITVANQEYLQALDKYNQTNINAKLTTQLRVIEPAEPGLVQPSKKLLLVVGSGVSSFVFCVVVLFIIFLSDSTIKTPYELVNKTGIPVLGYLCFVPDLNSNDLKNVWDNGERGVNGNNLKKLVQSLRFEVDSVLMNEKILLINSAENAEGKSFVAINLANAYVAIGKTVLLIDGNFDHPTISAFDENKYFIEDLLADRLDKSFFNSDSQLKVLGNMGGSKSILEIASTVSLSQKLEMLNGHFDRIIIEASSLETLNRSKEWVQFADKVLTVFEYGKNINEGRQQNLVYLKSLNNKFIGWVLNSVNGNSLI